MWIKYVKKRLYFWSKSIQNLRYKIPEIWSKNVIFCVSKKNMKFDQKTWFFRVFFDTFLYLKKYLKFDQKTWFFWHFCGVEKLDIFGAKIVLKNLKMRVKKCFFFDQILSFQKLYFWVGGTNFDFWVAEKNGIYEVLEKCFFLDEKFDFFWCRKKCFFLDEKLDFFWCRKKCFFGM